MSTGSPNNGSGLPVPGSAGPVPASATAHPPAPAPEPYDEGEGGADLQRYIQAFLRFKWVIIVAGLLGLGGGVAAVKLTKPQYSTHATVWISSPRTAGGPAPIVTGQLLRSASWIELLKSNTVLDPVVRELRLYLTLDNPADSAAFAGFELADRFRPGRYALVREGDRFVLRTQEGVVVERVARGDSVGRELGFRWVPSAGAATAERPVRFAVTQPRDAARQLAGDLRARVVDKDGNFLRIDLTGPNPARVAQTVNTVVDHYIAVATQLKRDNLTELSAILEEQLAKAQENLKAAENALESFRIRTVTLPSEPAAPVTPGLQQTQGPVFSSFFTMKIQLDQLQQDRAAIEQALASSAETGIRPGELEAIGAVQQSTELSMALRDLVAKQAALRAQSLRYTEEHPAVERGRQDVQTLAQEAIPALARRLIDDLRSREAALQERISSVSRELTQIPPRMIEEGRLQRDVAIADKLYTMLQSRYEEARLAELSSVPDVRPLDPAGVPQRPVQDAMLRLLLMGLAGGLGVGVGLVLLLDRLDRKVRYPEQVTSLGLPILGVVPHLRRNNGRPEDSGPVIEALRGIRLSLVHAHGAPGPLALTVTSPGAGDGKSFVAANLALAFADAGHPTVLVDGDVRRGGLHRVFNVARKPGLTDRLGNGLRTADILQATQTPTLQLIGCGTRRATAPEQVSSQAMGALIEELKQQFSVVIVDSPPLGAGVDAFALGTWTGQMLLVLRTGSTDREMAEAKLDMVDRLPVRVVGAVLNGVRERNVYRYYSYYLPGYDVDEEADDEAPSAGNRVLGTA